MDAVIVTEASAKEIAALVLAVQGRQKQEKSEMEPPHKGRLVTAYKNGRVFLKRLER